MVHEILKNRGSEFAPMAVRVIILGLWVQCLVN